MRRLVFVALLLASFAAQAQLPPGKWWRKPEIVRQLALTEEQQMRLDQIFRGAANDLIDLRGEVEKQSVALRGEIDQPQLNRGNIRSIGAKLNEARGRLFDRELMMLVDMRGVLNDQQWNRMRAVLDRPRMQNREKM
jgi:hypothetical protein